MKEARLRLTQRAVQEEEQEEAGQYKQGQGSLPRSELLGRARWTAWWGGWVHAWHTVAVESGWGAGQGQQLGHACEFRWTPAQGCPGTYACVARST